jgi:hypothetical protein
MPLGVGTQQAPVGGGGAHGLLAQLVPSPRYVPPRALQSSCVVWTHMMTPPPAMQQAPVTEAEQIPGELQLVPSP